MKSKLISKENGEAKFEMEFSAEELEDAKIKVYQRNKDKYQVDGFRKGKAPRSIIEKKYGENTFADDAVQDLLNLHYGDTLKELDIEPIDMPRMEFSQLAKGEGFTATLTVETYPENEVKDYKGIEVAKEPYEVTDEDVDHEMGHLRKRNARMIDVDRAVKNGDFVTLDFKGFVDGKAFDGGEAEDYTLVVGSGTFIPGFEEQLIGLSAGDEKDVEVTFPEKYQAANLSGKDALFKCKIKDVKEEELPELDDEFAKDVSEFDTLEELKEDTRKHLEETRKQAAENRMKDEAIRNVAKKNELNVPEILITQEIDAMLKQYDQQFQQQGLSLQGFLETTNQSENDFRETLKKEAEERVRSQMVVRYITEHEELEVSDEDIQNELKKMADQFNLELEEVEKMADEETKNYIADDLKMKKAIDFVFENATLVEPEKEEEEDK
jgi:trigger factor